MEHEREVGVGAMPASRLNCWYRIVEAGSGHDSDSLLRSDAGRFHRDPQSEPTTYAASSLRTAWLEHSQDDPNPDPSKFKALAIECFGEFCDLRQPEERQRCGITVQELRMDPAPERCRAVARQLRSQGMRGIIYHSNRDPQGTCVAIFLENARQELRCRDAAAEWESFSAMNGESRAHTERRAG